MPISLGLQLFHMKFPFNAFRYNKLASEVHDDSCSSESEDELKDCKDDKDICSVM